MNSLASPFISATAGTDIDGILNVIPDLGVVALLTIIIYGGFRKWWVFGWTHNELLERHEKLREDRDKWQDIAMRSNNLVETLTELQKGVRQ